MASAAPDAFPSPPSYEEAIGRPLENHPSAPPSDLIPQDFNSSHHGRSTGTSADEDEQDLEDERDYEESRPLKMGRIPDARAQYTFIQPSDTINNSANQHILSAMHRHAPGHHPNNSIVQQSQQQYAPPAHCPPSFAPPPSPSPPPPPPAPSSSSSSQMNSSSQPKAEKYRHDTFNAESPGSGQASSSSVSGSTSYAPPPFPPPPSISGEAGLSGASGSTSYAPPPFPPPPSVSVSIANPIPLAGIPEAPGLMNAQDVSIADYNQTKRGAESADKILEDPYQLYRFFVAHNDRPTMHVLITGHHIEKEETWETDSNGNRKLVTRDKLVNDFKMDFDLTPYISPRGTLYTAPDSKTGKTLTIREVMEQYAEEENPFKEMHMQKMVAWDYEELTRAITHAIRSVNYRYTIGISYPCTNNVVIVRSSSPLANFMRNGWTKALCFITLVGFIAYPAREIYKKVKDKTLKSEFQMIISTRDFYMQNYWSIVDQVQYK